jgi:2-polyprenyl-3-methyl-5-hydroxy-6-metoxy-1,4-benzoquinol methylase
VSITPTLKEIHAPEALAKDGNWTPAAISRFWEYYGRRTDWHGEYFTFQVAEGVANFLIWAGRLNPGMEVLDYGCGAGFLLEKLLTRGVNCHGVENSPKAIELTNRKFHNNSNWKGAVHVSKPPAPFPDRSFDTITCLETLEHLLDDGLPAVVKEIYRLLKPSGTALFTTPNSEDLFRSHIYCPFCETSFHKVQHVRSFSEESIRALLESHGFRIVFCRGINFDAFQRRPSLRKWKDLSLREIGKWIRSRKNTFLDRMAPKPFPQGRDFNRRAIDGTHHLCALVERPD